MEPNPYLVGRGYSLILHKERTGINVILKHDQTSWVEQAFVAGNPKTFDLERHDYRIAQIVNDLIQDHRAFIFRQEQYDGQRIRRASEAMHDFMGGVRVNWKDKPKTPIIKNILKMIGKYK